MTLTELFLEIDCSGDGGICPFVTAALLSLTGNSRRVPFCLE
jgi:hypothetical protein